MWINEFEFFKRNKKVRGKKLCQMPSKPFNIDMIHLNKLVIRYNPFDKQVV